MQEINYDLKRKHFAYPSIGQFKNVIRNVQHTVRYIGQDENGDPQYDNLVPLPTLTAVGTTKLHGTNAGIVRYKDGSTGVAIRWVNPNGESHDLNHNKFVKEVSGEIGERKAGEQRNIMREDIVKNETGEKTPEIISNFPDKDGDYLKVKKII